MMKRQTYSREAAGLYSIENTELEYSAVYVGYNRSVTTFLVAEKLTDEDQIQEQVLIHGNWQLKEPFQLVVN